MGVKANILLAVYNLLISLHQEAPDEFANLDEAFKGYLEKSELELKSERYPEV